MTDNIRKVVGGAYEKNVKEQITVVDDRMSLRISPSLTLILFNGRQVSES